MRKTAEFGTVTTYIQRLRNNYKQDLLHGSTGEVKSVKTKEEDLVNCFVLSSKWDLREIMYWSKNQKHWEEPLNNKMGANGLLEREQGSRVCVLMCMGQKHLFIFMVQSWNPELDKPTSLSLTSNLIAELMKETLEIQILDRQAVSSYRILACWRKHAS